MSVVVETERSFFLTVPAVLINDQHDCASSWASKFIKPNKWHKWVLAKYVEADNANSNQQYWSLEGLQSSVGSIENTPMNLGHKSHSIIGSWSNAELLYPDAATAGDTQEHPYVETLGVFWRYYFNDLMPLIESAYESSSLAVSMECVADSVTCVGENSCGETYDYMGPFHDSYCAGINGRTTAKQFNNPHFLAGALLLPPDKPGWSNADVKELASLSSDEEKDRLISDLNDTFTDMDAADLEKLMFTLQAHSEANSVVEAPKTPASFLAGRVAAQFLADSYR